MNGTFHGVIVLQSILRYNGVSAPSSTTFLVKTSLIIWSMAEVGALALSLKIQCEQSAARSLSFVLCVLMLLENGEKFQHIQEHFTVYHLVLCNIDFCL